ncbi:hypothetical protein BCR39DRAFT_465969 [Naematelia encephala]|uniref:Transcription elongation factor SPT5 n=1 Tax=Naematelia encephala TaxID=71784 RepID=A0A1Y2B9Q5_9TREE|nr:hypothetical protein BCR39DRAFT_465969 [Naematelia encephala]
MSDVEGSSSPIEEKSSRDGSAEPSDANVGRKRPRDVDPDEKEDEEEKVEVEKEEDAGGDNRNNDEDEDEDDDDDDDDDEDEEDEERGEGERKKKRRKKNRVNRFIDIEAEVDEDDEEEELDDYEDVAGFIDEQPDDEAIARDDYAHRRLDQVQGRNDQESVEDIVQRLKQRHGRMAAARYNADSDRVPQRLLMPVEDRDPSLWKVYVKPGREQGIAASIFRKTFDAQYSANPIDVISVFYRDSLSGLIFVEARQSGPVTQALHGIVGVFMSRGVTRVPLEEMAPLLKIKKKDVILEPHMWIRMKRGKNAGDLAEVVDVDQMTSGVVGIKFIPRIDLTPREKKKERAANGRAGGSSSRPPARLFNPDDVRKIYGRGSVRSGGGSNTYLFDNDEYIEGFCIRDVKINLIETENVKPTLEEISQFSGSDDQTATKIDLSAIADAHKNIAASALFPGDKVEVYEGEQSGLYGAVVAVTPDVITIRAEGGEIHGQTVEVPAKSARKRFEIGEHVKILSGKNLNATGMVVEVRGDVVTLMSDQGEQEIKVFSKDLRKAAELAGTSDQAGMFDLHDMVMLDVSTAGVIIRMEGAILHVIDQNGAVRVVTPQQVTPRRENRLFAVATDSQGNDMKVGDAMKETSGENRRGEVINIYRSLFVFLHNREIAENNGVFVARAGSLVSVTPKSAVNDLSKLNPALNAAYSAVMPPPPMDVNRGRLVNTLVVVTKGTQKGLVGVIRDVLGTNARVELTTNNKLITIPMTSLKRKDAKTGNTFPLDTGSAAFASYNGRPTGGYDINPYANGGATPAPGGRTPAVAYGRTPNPYAVSKGGYPSRTPNPYAMGGGQTPALGGRTPAPGSRTPGWAGAGGKTPYGGGMDGGRTPGWAGAGAGGKTPLPGGSREDMASSRNAAPTPWAPIHAPTPAAGPYSAPTPWANPTPMNAPTPGPATAPTPAAYSAPTPGGVFSAPTPGQFNAVPTPYAAPTPAYSAPSNGLSGQNDVPWDWALDFSSVMVEVGPSTRPGTRNPLHFRRGALDGQLFGYSSLADEETPRCVLLTDPNVTEDIGAEYLRPGKPTMPGQVVVVVAGPARGQQRTTQYQNDDLWMMELEQGDVQQLVIPDRHLCRIWKT